MSPYLEVILCFKYEIHEFQFDMYVHYSIKAFVCLLCVFLPIILILGIASIGFNHHHIIAHINFDANGSEIEVRLTNICLTCQDFLPNKDYGGGGDYQAFNSPL